MQKTYGLVAGIALLVAAVVFLALPGLLDYDATIPVILAIVAFIGGLVALFTTLTGGGTGA